MLQRPWVRIVFAGFVLAAFAMLAAGADAPAAERLPNIVFFLADDMGYGDPRCLNPDSKIPTPHMDRLAAEGMVFRDAHSPSAVCSPIRYGILTGRITRATCRSSGAAGRTSARACWAIESATSSIWRSGSSTWARLAPSKQRKWGTTTARNTL